MKTRLIKILSLLLVCLLLFSACGSKKDDTPVKEPEKNDPVVVDPTPQPQPTPQPEPDKNIYVNPLSGVLGPVDLKGSRPYAVMINNHKNAQPQLGINEAEIIYEIIAEGGITRMMAIFQDLSAVGDIGTVRSARPYYINLATGHDAIFVHAGASEDAYELLKEINIDRMDGVNGKKDARIFWRDEWRKENKGYEHSLLTSGSNILDYVRSAGIRTTQNKSYKNEFKFTSGNTPATASGNKADFISIRFSNYKTGTFEYSANEKKYLAWQFDDAYRDGNTGNQYSVKNILVLETESRVYDDYGRNEFTTTGKGSGSYFCEGKEIPITWERKTVNDCLKFKTADGKDLELMAGNSYIAFINTKNSKVEFE